MLSGLGATFADSMATPVMVQHLVHPDKMEIRPTLGSTNALSKYNKCTTTYFVLTRNKATENFSRVKQLKFT